MRIKEIVEFVLILVFLVFAYGVGAYYDTQVYNELYGTTATTEMVYGENIGA